MSRGRGGSFGRARARDGRGRGRAAVAALIAGARAVRRRRGDGRRGDAGPDPPRGGDPAGEPQLRQRARPAVRERETDDLQVRDERPEQERRNDPAERSGRQGAPGRARPGSAADGDEQRQDERLRTGRRLRRTAVLHRVRRRTRQEPLGNGAQRRDRRPVLLARHRPLLGRAPRLLRPDAGRVRGQQPQIPRRRAGQGARLGLRLPRRLRMDRARRRNQNGAVVRPRQGRPRRLPGNAGPVRADRRRPDRRSRADVGDLRGAAGRTGRLERRTRKRRSVQMGDLPDLRRVPRRSAEKRHARSQTAVHRRGSGEPAELRDPHPDHGHGRDEPAQRHLDGPRRRIHRERGQGDPGRSRTAPRRRSSSTTTTAAASTTTSSRRAASGSGSRS